MSAQEPVLELKNIVKTFPGVIALDHVSLDILPGEVHASWAKMVLANQP